VSNASISVPFLSYRRDKFLEGRNPVKLDGYLAGAPFDVAAGTISAATQAFSLPPALVKAPATRKRTKSGGAHKLTAHLGTVRRKGRTTAIVVYGDAPRGSVVMVQLVRSGHVVATRKVKARLAAFRARFTGARAGRYSARVTARLGSKKLRASVRARRVR
jgi:hypothetical protein